MCLWSWEAEKVGHQLPAWLVLEYCPIMLSVVSAGSLMAHLDPCASPGGCQVRPGPPPQAVTDTPYLSLVASLQATLTKSI